MFSAENVQTAHQLLWVFMIGSGLGVGALVGALWKNFRLGFQVAMWQTTLHCLLLTGISAAYL